MKGVEESFVTSLAFDDNGVLWVSGFDGIIRGYEHNDKEIPLAQLEPLYEIKFGQRFLKVYR